ncbi:hypothetical protein KUCAC02_001061 [Chaenocephalus aceratus]|uniref:Uncharacterized protein n=1 Tax=Chaenocephalus aceratus TaxID=36190 RepID=A0ACB9XWL8_CHAAC|nr:hypothetical protein KUCAC02_001061 [Chaenocephalus aceratus]
MQPETIYQHTAMLMWDWSQVRMHLQWKTHAYDALFGQLDRKLTYPNTERLFPEFTNPFCFSPSSQLDFEHPIQMMVSVLPKQLEKAGSCSRNVGACGRLPNQSQDRQRKEGKLFSPSFPPTMHLSASDLQQIALCNLRRLVRVKQLKGAIQVGTV